MSCWNPLGRQSFRISLEMGLLALLTKASCPLAYLDIQESLMTCGSRPKVFTIGDPLPVSPLCQEHPDESFIFLPTPAITQHGGAPSNG